LHPVRALVRCTGLLQATLCACVKHEGLHASPVGQLCEGYAFPGSNVSPLATAGNSLANCILQVARKAKQHAEVRQMPARQQQQQQFQQLQPL
jgi:hypothetical protein